MEVKGTGESAFEYFSEKDIKADYLVWIHFGDFFKDTSRKTVNVVTVRNPSEFFKGTMKITLDKLEKTSAYHQESLNLEALGSILRPRKCRPNVDQNTCNQAFTRWFLVWQPGFGPGSLAWKANGRVKRNILDQARLRPHRQTA